VAPSPPPSLTATTRPAESPGARPGPAIGVVFRFPLSASVDLRAGNATATADLNDAIAISPFVQFWVNRNVALGGGLNYFPSFRVTGDPASSSQLDVMLKFAIAAHLSSAVTLYAEGGPGYSLIFWPDSVGQGKPDPEGAVVSVDLGATVALAQSVHLLAGFGYEKGFQSTSVPSGTTSVDEEIHVGYVELFAGLAMQL